MRRFGLGVGLDLPWSGPYGIVDGRVSPRTVQFLTRHADRFSNLFVSWQPRDKGVTDLQPVFDAWDDLFAQVRIPNRTLHQTAFNLAGGDYDRTPLVALTNTLVDRYDMAWVNEDLGFWSVSGRPLPYPQPPPLTEAGVAHCAATCAEVDRALNVPLSVEFPGFETPAPWLRGELDAYDAFREVVQRADVACTLDTGHLLTWRWLQGHRGEALFDGLERLPLEHCIELHCAGTAQVGEALVDAHHGVLHPAQLELASRLMARCANLRVVTYEDPRFDAAGTMPPEASAGLAELERRTSAWFAAAPPLSSRPRAQAAPPPRHPPAEEHDLWAAFCSDGDFGRRCRAQLGTRSALGIGRLEDLYGEAIETWRATAEDPDDLDPLWLQFLLSPAGAEWSEYAWAVPGRCVEDAFGRFLCPGSVAHQRACARVLLMHPEPVFVMPDGFVRAPGGWFAIVLDDPPVLVAATGGRLVVGAITSELAEVLQGSRAPGSEAVERKLVDLGLLGRSRVRSR